MQWKGKAWHDKARHGMAWLGKAMAWLGKAMAWHDKAWKWHVNDMAWLGKAWKWHDMKRYGNGMV
jgi:hypothetical protein